MIRVSSSLSDDDYSVSPSDKSILFRAGADDGTLTISAADDYLVESDEYLTVYLIDPHADDCWGANLGSKQRLNVVITDNDGKHYIFLFVHKSTIWDLCTYVSFDTFYGIPSCVTLRIVNMQRNLVAYTLVTVTSLTNIDDTNILLPFMNFR